MSKLKSPLFKRTAIPAHMHEVQEEDLQDGNDLPAEAPPEYFEHKPLSVNETKRLSELEGVITRNFQSFYAVGCALREIREKRLYRSTHQRFDFYCRDLWEMQRSRAYQFIESADVVDLVSGCISDENVHHGGQKNVSNWRQIEWVPQNERQARALAKYAKQDPEKIRVLIAEAVTTAPKGQVTASHIKKTARKLQMETVCQAVIKTKQRANSAPKISEDFRKAFNAFLDQINIERMCEYKHTDRKEVIRYTQVILDALLTEL